MRARRRKPPSNAVYGWRSLDALGDGHVRAELAHVDGLRALDRFDAAVAPSVSEVSEIEIGDKIGREEIRGAREVSE